MIIAEQVKAGMRRRVEEAPLGHKLGFYQNRYLDKRFGQLAWLVRIYGMQALRGRDIVRKERFADYQKKMLYRADTVWEELDQYEVISFDVFDTLIRRTVSRPVDVFHLLEQTYHVPGFAKQRIEAEVHARQLKMRTHKTKEVCIEEIYEAMQAVGVCHAPLLAKEYELDMELACCVANPVMHQLAGRLLAAGKQVIAVSDMYLHQSQIQKLLCQCGYENFKAVYVSCDFGVGKSDGKLFPIIQKEIGEKRRLIHIGDNFYADVYRQKPLGIRALHYVTGTAKQKTESGNVCVVKKEHKSKGKNRKR